MQLKKKEKSTLPKDDVLIDDLQVKCVFPRQSVSYFDQVLGCVP